METEYYWGDYTSYGHPTLILTEFENSTHYFIQGFIYFETNPSVFFKELFWMLKKGGFGSSKTLKEFVLNTQIRKELNDYILQRHGQSDATFQFWNTVNFHKTNHSIIAYLRDKFLAELNQTETKAKDNKLMEYIKLYKSIEITRIPPDEFSW